MEIDDEENRDDANAAVADAYTEITDEDIERAQLMRTEARDRLHGESAVALGYDFGFFEDANTNTTYVNTARNMQPGEGDQICTWEAQLKATTNEQLKQTGVINITEELNNPGPSISSAEPMSITTPEIQSQACRPISGR
jgi:hypothetical protein